MSQRNSNTSSQILLRRSESEACPYRDDRSDSSRNRNGKRPRDNLREDQVETEAPRKLARLDRDHHSEREESQQPSNAMANTSDAKREQEFVDGPGHIVFIDERGKRCPAICFNKLLLSTFRDIAVFSRDVRQRDKEIQKAKLELERIESSNQSAGIEKAKRIVEEIEAGIPDLVEARRRFHSLTQENKWPKLNLEDSREFSRFVIEQILDREHLLNVPSSKPQAPVEDTKEKSSEPALVYDTDRVNVPMADPASSSTGLQSPINTEEHFSPRQLALREFRWAAEELDYCKGRFTFMQEAYAQEVAAERRYHQEQYPERAASTTQTDVDLKTLRKKQKATRRLIEAEEAYDRAEQQVEALGIGDILGDPQAYYCGEIYNDFRPRTPKSPTVLPIFSVDRPRIEAWMASVPNSAEADPRRQEEAEPVGSDDWEAKSVEMFDSISVVACEMDRKRIAKWQELSGRCGEDEAKGPLPKAVRRNPRRRC